MIRERVFLVSSLRSTHRTHLSVTHSLRPSTRVKHERGSANHVGPPLISAPHGRCQDRLGPFRRERQIAGIHDFTLPQVKEEFRLRRNADVRIPFFTLS